MDWLVALGIPDIASKKYAQALDEDGYETVPLLSELDEEVSVSFKSGEQMTSHILLGALL